MLKDLFHVRRGVCSRALAFALVFIISQNLFAQTELWGITPYGGTSGKGTIFRYEDGALETVHHFYSPYAGRAPYAVKVLVASNSRFYGTTDNGGIYDGGVIFEYDPATGIYSVLHHFDYMKATGGFGPRGSLMQASNGKLYGTAYGGTYGGGVIFEYDLSTGTFEVVHNFEFTSGAAANQTILTEADNGKLLGVAPLGGAHGGGVIFEFDIASKLYANKFDFNSTTGTNPQGGLIRASNGKFYGVLREGGWGFKGGIFEYDAATNTVVVKKFFGENPDGSSVSGGSPEYPPVEHPNGKFYGVTPKGGTWGAGVLYELDINTNTVIKKGEFGPLGSVPGGNASTPFGGVTVGSNGNLYGATAGGGPYDAVGGFIFEYNLSNNFFRAKQHISSSRSTLVEKDGVFYGVNVGGGNGDGDLFGYTLATNTVTSLFHFDDAPEGGKPLGAVTQALNGKFYGVAAHVASSNYSGAIYEIDPATGVYTRKHSFSSSSGPSRPTGALSLHPNGKLYGMTLTGNGYQTGSIIEFDPQAGVVTRHLFLGYNPAVNGEQPLGELTLARNGMFYALISRGGSNSAGTLIEYDPQRNTITKKFDFGGANGTIPKGSLTLAPNGRLYGATSAGGSNGVGVLFEFDPASGIVVKKADFTQNTGSNPEGKMVAAGNGSLYGMTMGGGSGNFGLIYRYEISTGTLTVVHTFSAAPSGNRPIGGTLVEDSDGMLYGMARYGGDKNYGTLFKLDPATNIVTTIHSFTGVDGIFPEHSSLTLRRQVQTIDATVTSVTKTYGDAPFSITTSASSGLPVFYVSSDPGVAVIENGLVVIKGAGTAMIYSMQEGSNTYLPAAKQVTLTVNKATLSARGRDVSKKYGEVLPALEIEYSGFIGSDNKAVLNTSPQVTTEATQFSDAGTYPITLAGGSDDNYAITLQDGTLTIEKTTLTAIAEDKSRKYGETNPGLTIRYEGFAGSDNSAVLDSQPQAATTASPGSDTGEYPISLSGGDDNNYIIIRENGKLTVTKATLTATAPDKTRGYGEENPPLTIVYNGFVNNDNASMLDSPPSAFVTATPQTSAGTYPITLSGGDDNNYTIARENGALTITKAQLTATASDKARAYGEENPAFTITYSGFVNNDNASVLDSPPATIVTATAQTNVGTVPIVLAGGEDNNYSFKLVNGTLSIVKAQQVITFPLIPSKTMGDAPFQLTVSASSRLPVTLVSSNAAIAAITGSTVTIVKSGSVEIVASQIGNSNYLPASDVMQVLNIETITGLEESASSETLELYPNPATEKIYLTCRELLHTVLIVNATGSVLMRMNDMADTFEVDVAVLPSGLYQVIALSEKRKFKSRLIKL